MKINNVGVGVKLMKKLFLLITLISTIFLISYVSAYPSIISESGVNHTQAKELIYSIPEKYYKYVKAVEFVNEPIGHNAGWYDIQWDSGHNCYNGKIGIYYFPNTILNHYIYYEILQHEIGHIIDHCINKSDFSTEDFANKFIIK